MIVFLLMFVVVGDWFWCVAWLFVYWCICVGFEVSFAVGVGLCYMFVAWLLNVLLIARLWLFLVVIWCCFWLFLRLRGWHFDL